MDHRTTIIGGGIVAETVVVALFLWVWTRRIARQHKTVTGAASKLATSLRDERLKSDIILSAIEDGVVLIDDQKIIRLFNPGASDTTGWPADEALGLDFHQVLKLVDAKDVAYQDENNPLVRIFKSTAPIRDNNAILVSRSNKRFPISLSISPLIDENKHVTAAVAIFRDVSRY